jgi:DNA recombination protein RmuC
MRGIIERLLEVDMVRASSCGAHFPLRSRRLGGFHVNYVLVFILGLLCGSAVVFVVNRRAKRDVEKTFAALSFDALSKNSQEFLRLANETLAKQAQSGTGELEGKRLLIDKTVEDMKANLKNVQQLITDFEKDRTKKYEELANQLKSTAEATCKLQDTAGHLQTALADSRARGQWGERMAEDVLRLAGFVENVNYVKQSGLAAGASRPDYTFLLPQSLKVNMDVKFPLDNYMKYQSEEVEAVREAYKAQFLKDVRQRIKEVTTREYISPQDQTVDYVLVFIPNEQVYCFINENDNTVIDDALKTKVVLCSPTTLYAILAIMRQAVDNFSLERTASEVLGLLGSFGKQWLLFKAQMDRIGNRIDDARKEYDRLVATRSHQLERPLEKIEDIRKQKGIIATELENVPALLGDGTESTAAGQDEG